MKKPKNIYTALYIYSNYGEVLYLSTVYSDLNDVIMPVGYDGLKTARQEVTEEKNGKEN